MSLLSSVGMSSLSLSRRRLLLRRYRSLCLLLRHPSQRILTLLILSNHLLQVLLLLLLQMLHLLLLLLRLLSVSRKCAWRSAHAATWRSTHTAAAGMSTMWRSRALSLVALVLALVALSLVLSLVVHSTRVIWI